MRARLDSLDLRLLDRLQKNNLETADELSEAVGRSPSAIARRLRRLRADRTVSADVSLITEEAAGFPLFAVVQIQLDRHALAEADLLRRQLTASENVQLCFDVSGTFDMLLLVVTADMDGFNAFADRVLADQPAVRRYETTFVKRRAKATLAMPLEQLLLHTHGTGEQRE